MARLKPHFRILTWVASVAGGLIGLLALLAGIFRLLNRNNGTLVSGGEKRRYLLYVPKSYQPGKPTPLVLSFHGYAEWPAHQMEISRWNRLADRRGFIVVYPCGTGLPLRWRIYRGAAAAREVQFISDLIDLLELQYSVDPGRIFANGLSNGAGMSFLLSCRLSGRINAIGGVGGAYLFSADDCRPERPVPLIVFHGTADPIVPFHGGPSRAFQLPFPDIPDWVEAYARRCGCAEAVELPAQGEASGVRYPAGEPGAEVEFYTIHGGGHTWPGGNPLPDVIAGRTSLDIDATERMWEFFSRQTPLHEK